MSDSKKRAEEIAVNGEVTQEANGQLAIGAETGQAPTPPKKQAISATYTLKAFGEHADKLFRLNLITAEELSQVKEIRKNAVDKYWK